MTQRKEQRLSPAGLTLAHVRLDRLRANWRHIRSLAGDDDPARVWPAAMPVIKADAYGHGLVRVAETLLAQGAKALAVGSVAEAVILRRAMARKTDARAFLLLPLLGLQNMKDARDALHHDLVPFVHDKTQLELLAAAHSSAAGKSPLPVAVKIDTGMSRLGFAASDPGAVLDLLRSFPMLRPSLLATHMAAADDPEALDSVRRQIARFRAVFETLCGAWPDLTPSFANSPATLADKELAAGFPFHVRRPGFVLYGGNPFAGTSLERLGAPLRPTMEVTAPVLSVHDLAKGETVSYGRTFAAPKAMRVAVVGAGYADGYSRGLSGKGFVCLHKIRCPILGRVCMQMHIVDVSRLPQTAVGDTAHLLGGDGPGAISPDDLAAAWGTIPYEIFCLLGKNPRVFHG